MALYCQKPCTEPLLNGLLALGTSCTLDGLSVPCDLTNPKIQRDPVCGFETNKTALDEGTDKCNSIQQQASCTYEGTVFQCWKKQIGTELQGGPQNETTTTFTSVSTTSPSSTIVQPASSTSSSQALESSSSTRILQVESTFSTFTNEATGTIATFINASANTSIPGIIPKEDSGGLSPGATAGIGIGSAILGVIVAVLVLLILFRRYKKRLHESAGYSNHHTNYNPEVGRQEKGLPMSNTMGSVVIDSYLPQPAKDDAIVGELSRLRDNIKNHVQSFYITGPVEPQALDRSLLREIGRETGTQSSELQILLVNGTTRNSALRLCIAWLVLSRCDGRGAADMSLLPEEAAAVVALISDIEHKDMRRSALASNLKVITGTLLQTRSRQPLTFQTAKLNQKIEQTVVCLNAFLAPFIDSSIDAMTDKRIRNLENIVRRASQLALLLFSQPSSWALDFRKSGKAQEGTIVVFPGILETEGEDGVARETPRQLYTPEVTAAL